MSNCLNVVERRKNGRNKLKLSRIQISSTSLDCDVDSRPRIVLAEVVYRSRHRDGSSSLISLYRKAIKVRQLRAKVLALMRSSDIAAIEFLEYRIRTQIYERNSFNRMRLPHRRRSTERSRSVSVSSLAGICARDQSIHVSILSRFRKFTEKDSPTANRR